MNADTPLQSFLKERSAIITDIKHFLYVILKYVWRVVKQYKCVPEAVLKPESTRSLFESLCLIHGLYGFPDPHSSVNNITVNKDAVKEIVLNEISVNGMKFVDICEDVNTDKFWEFGVFSLASSPREPAYLFLELVRDLFGDHQFTGEISREYLEELPDVNYLKPAVWAEHKDKPACCGVSLGVRAFVRPLYLYIKLRQLRVLEDGHTGVKLNDVIAYESKINKKLLIKSDPTSKRMTKYEVKKEPCNSCQVFFWFSVRSRRNLDKSFPPFGNCAEYDVIRTKNLDYLLNHIARTTNQWDIFESACQRHCQAFHELTACLDQGGDSSEAMNTYHRGAGDGKILRYQKYTTPYNTSPQFRLIADSSRVVEKQPKPTTKRRKTAS